MTRRVELLPPRPPFRHAVGLEVEGAVRLFDVVVVDPDDGSKVVLAGVPDFRQRRRAL